MNERVTRNAELRDFREPKTANDLCEDLGDATAALARDEVHIVRSVDLQTTESIPRSRSAGTESGVSEMMRSSASRARAKSPRVA